MKRRLKINGVIIFCAFLLIVFLPSLFLRRKTPFFDQAAEIVGVAVILLGQLIRVSSRGYKSENSGNGHILIRGGPYTLVRNPMYLGIFLIGIGMVLVLFNWWVGCIFLFIFSIRYFLLIFKEERKLKARFPQDYPDYRQQVPRILPAFSALLQKDISEYLPLKLPWLKKEIGSILAVLLVTLFLESWQDIKAKGMGGYSQEAIAYSSMIILFVGVVIYLSKRTEGLGRNVSNKSKTN